MSNFIGTGDGSTLLVLTDAESRLIRKVLDHPGLIVEPETGPLQAYNRGITRGTALLAREFAEKQQAKKK